MAGSRFETFFHPTLSERESMSTRVEPNICTPTYKIKSSLKYSNIDNHTSRFSLAQGYQHPAANTLSPQPARGYPITFHSFSAICFFFPTTYKVPCHLGH